MLKLLHKKEANNPYIFIPSCLEDRLLSASIKKRNSKIKVQYLKKLKNHNFSIICDYCVGGSLSNILDEQQRSPFVNMLISSHDYYKLLTNLKYYLSCEFVEVKTSNTSYPVACLGDICLKLVHYKSFEEAKEKWYRRIKRINYNNLFVIISDGWADDGNNHIPDSLYEKFLKLDYENMIFITNKKGRGNGRDRVVYLKKYHNSKMLYPGSIELFGGKTCFERYFDVIRWLNKNA